MFVTLVHKHENEGVAEASVGIQTAGPGEWRLPLLLSLVSRAKNA